MNTVISLLTCIAEYYICHVFFSGFLIKRQKYTNFVPNLIFFTVIVLVHFGVVSLNLSLLNLISFVTMIISIIGVVGIRVGWIVTVFARYHTPEMLFITYIITWVITFIAQFIAFQTVYKKKKAELGSVD